MEKNAIIKIRLIDLLGILEARECVAVYVEGREAWIKSGKVYDMLVDKDFIKIYGNRFVTGLISFPIVTNILIDKMVK
jgi:hypothetical protein